MPKEYLLNRHERERVFVLISKQRSCLILVILSLSSNEGRDRLYKVIDSQNAATVKIDINFSLNQIAILSITVLTCKNSLELL